jgi:uncharacterized protein (TIGR00288 family)
MQEKMNIAVFVDYDNIEIGVKSTLRRDFSVGLVLDALKERGHLVAKFAYANWSRQEFATRHMAENAVQMVQRIPSPRGDKNGADINLALDALEMAFTHQHVTAFAIVSGDSDFIPLVNKLKEYGKTVFIVGGKAFTSTILQQNCHEFISYESLLDDGQRFAEKKPAVEKPQQASGDKGDRKGQPPPQQQQQQRNRPAPLDLGQAVPLVERALEVLERRAVQPQLGLLKSTMLQLTPSFNEKAYGASSFSEFVEKLKHADYVKVSGSGGKMVIERKSSHIQEKPAVKPEDALPSLRDVLETHRLDMEEGVPAVVLKDWMVVEVDGFDWKKYGFQEFEELLNFAQDRTVVRAEPDEEKGLMIYLGAEFYPPAPPMQEQTEDEPHPLDEKQPIVAGQPSFLEPDPKPVNPRTRSKSAAKTKSAGAGGSGGGSTRRTTRRKKVE